MYHDIICPLCGSLKTTFYNADKIREYYKCPYCLLIFVPKIYHISSAKELERYSKHYNSIADEGYIDYLTCVADEFDYILPANGTTLDYGAGKNSVLANILRRKGYSCDAYDPLYETNRNIKKKCYNAIILCEVAEHFRSPAKEFLRISSLLSHSGYLCIRTELYKDDMDIKSWWYARDETHIVFFNQHTFKCYASLFNMKLIRIWNGKYAVLKSLM